MYLHYSRDVSCGQAAYGLTSVLLVPLNRLLAGRTQNIADLHNRLLAGRTQNIADLHNRLYAAIHRLLAGRTQPVLALWDVNYARLRKATSSRSSAFEIRINSMEVQIIY
ncbi:hypothetical protein D9613_004746 [Agrocybe pediades]|uniref:Uncharacterized protein n=1 Tax=Agrocybe pediades TaxID=84607 RepID=A0A8H4QZG1_9AGAR|nr:hypothetical protein D9613_004746 [Agrocybe pediades]